MYFPGGALYISSGNNYHGNDVILRDAYLPSGGEKSWFDIETPLPAGTLKRFFCYVHPMVGLSETSSVIRLQIWRPVVASEYRYMLVWEKKIVVDVTSSTGLLYNVSTFYFTFQVNVL